MKEVLDSRFLIEHFYSDDPETRKRTSRKLTELISRKEGILPTIVISETIRIACERVGKQEAKTSYLSLTGSGLQIQPLDEETAEQAGLLKCQYRGLPMGDCIIAATATISKARIVSDDTHFDIIRGVKRIWI